jgi:GNAT superfamily N-acetyltransferase
VTIVPSVEVVEGGGSATIGRLRELTDVALAQEALDLDALDTCCGGPDDAVLWLDDGSGAAVVAPGADPTARHLQLIAVVPAAGGEGRGRRLLEAAVELARDTGAERLELGGTATQMRYLWPGVDVRHLRFLALADSAGARWTGAAVNLSCPATFRAPPPARVELRRVIDDEDAHAAVEFTGGAFPHWLAELERGIEHGTAFVAAGDTGVVGFACHSVNRPGWFGPTAVDPARRGGGIGAALLAACCRDLMSAGRDSVEISWIGPVAFYAKVAGAAVSRVFRTGSFDLGRHRS